MNNSIPERFIFQCALFKNLEKEVFMTHGYVGDAANLLI